VSLAGFLAAALAYFLTFLKAETAVSNAYTRLLWTPLYSAVLGPFLFLPAEWWMRIKKRRNFANSM